MYIQLDEFSQNEQAHVNSTQIGIQYYQHPKRSALCSVLAITPSSDFYTPLFPSSFCLIILFSRNTGFNSTWRREEQENELLRKK